MRPGRELGEVAAALGALMLGHGWCGHPIIQAAPWEWQAGTPI